MSKFVSTSLCFILLAASVPANAEGQVLSNDLSKCRSGPSTLVQINGLKAGSGKVRVQSYRANASDWLAKGRWINRIEVPARAGSITVCVPLPASGSYGIAVRHDVNGNGKTDLSSDGGGMSNNPSINIFNLGKPSYKKTAFAVGDAPKTISITMKYM
ncbi:hypothetical protein BWQ93_11925 [Sphingopyxis sp. QXT-31]|nr:DUF2141 domain-containing protein [Sphingopyxis sp. QXT-31]APZ99120.1 hypothetical protein BWQ93_11925 [Sphingopyxis sp. QXT-31]